LCFEVQDGESSSPLTRTAALEKIIGKERKMSPELGFFYNW